MARSNISNYLTVEEQTGEYLDPLSFSLTGFRTYMRNKFVPTYTVGLRAESLDAIAFKSYQEENFYWFIAYYNGLEDLISPLPNGTTIGVPLLEDITAFQRLTRSTRPVTPISI